MYWTKRLTVLACLTAGLLLTLLCAGCGGSSGAPDPVSGTGGEGAAVKAGLDSSDKPVSVPDAFPREGGVPLLVHLFDGGSYDPGGEIVKWEWNFTDGGGGWHDYTASQGEAWHTYDKPGNRQVHLRVADDEGNTDVAHVTVVMRQGLNANPVAVATATPSTGNAPLEVQLSAAGSYDPDGTIDTYEWDFGQGFGFEPANSLNGGTTHTYETAGVYTAILRVTDDDGAESTNGVEITVTEPPHWFHTWGGEYEENPKAVVADVEGNVYVTGNTYSYSTRWYDVLLLCYDSLGNLQWARTWGGSGNEAAVCIAIGPDGHLYLAGATNSSFSLYGTDMMLLEYLPNGDFVDAWLWCGPDGESATGIAVDDMGVYVTGQRSTSTPTNLAYSGLLLRFDGDWTPTMEYAIVSQPINYGIYGYGILADGAGSLYLSGHTYKGGGIHDSGVAWVMRCSTSGVFDWGRMWYGPAYDMATSMCLDGETLYVGGHTGSYGMGGYDGFLLSMTTGGALNWQRTLGTTDNDYAQSKGIAPVTGRGKLYGAMTFGPVAGAYRLVLSEWDPLTGNLVSHVERQQDDGQMTYNTGLANLCAMPDGALVVTGNAVNAAGAWIPGTGAATACNGSFEPWTPELYEISGTMVHPTGVMSAPEGVIDVGGGQNDSGVGKYNFP